MDHYDFDDWWNESRQGLYRWMEPHAPHLAELYLGSTRLLCDRPPGWPRFIAHGIREIVNRLPREICGEEARTGHLEYSRRFDEIDALWDGFEIAAGSTSLREATTELPEVPVIPLPQGVAEAFTALLRDHRDTTLSNRERALDMLRAVVPPADGDTVQLRAVARQWTDVGRWAARTAHDTVRRDDDFDTAEIVRQFQILEGVLLGITRLFFENKEDIDALLDAANS